MGNLLSKDLEKFKGDLQIATIEHEIRFSKLHEKRAEVLAELYKLLVEAVWSAEEFASPMEFEGDPDKKEKYKNAMNAVAQYFRFFEQHRIYLPERLCPSLEVFARKLRKPTIRLGVYLSIEHPTENTIREKHEAWNEAWSTVKEEIPNLRAEIETEFRKLLDARDNTAQMV